MLLIVESVFALFLIFCYAVRLDALAALTVVPSWTWLCTVLPVLPFLRRKHRLYTVVFAAAWMLFLVLHVEEPRSVLRGWISPVKMAKSVDVIRLITSNCCGGQREILNEIAALKPDIVFLQEAPSEKAVRDFVRALYGASGGYVYDFDTSVLFRGRLTGNRKTRDCCSQAEALCSGAAGITLVSLRLLPVELRLDLWKPACWRAHRDHRREQVRQVQSIASGLAEAKSLIVAGDFNAPQGDRVFRFLPAGLRDSFAMGGRGIGNTVLNDIPVLRIDQIWVSRDFRVVQSFVLRSAISDHRMVVSDVIKNSPQE